MDAKTIKKYDKYDTKQLVQIAQKWCNKFIRARDEGNPCVSCKKYLTLEAGHFYAAGHYSNLRLDERNIFGQCSRCNRHLHGNLLEYRKNLDADTLQYLERKVQDGKRNSWKWDRFYLIDKIEYYKSKIKEL